jgi:hypothetical protein
MCIVVVSIIFTILYSMVHSLQLLEFQSSLDDVQISQNSHSHQLSLTLIPSHPKQTHTEREKGNKKI